MEHVREQPHGDAAQPFARYAHVAGGVETAHRTMGGQRESGDNLRETNHLADYYRQGAVCAAGAVVYLYYGVRDEDNSLLPPQAEGTVGAVSLPDGEIRQGETPRRGCQGC